MASKRGGKWTKGRFDKPTLKNDAKNLGAAIGLAAFWVAGPSTWFKLKGVPAFLLQFGIPIAAAKYFKWDNLLTATAAVGATHLMYYNLDEMMTKWGLPIWALDKEKAATVSGLSGAQIKTLPSGEQVVYYEGGMNDYITEGQPMLADYINEGEPMLADYFNEGDPMLADYINEGDPMLADYFASQIANDGYSFM